MKILNFGSLNIDKVYQVDNFVRPGETISSKNLNFFCGGKGLNQSIALAKAGAACILGAVCFFLVEKLREMKNPMGYLFYGQMAIYMMLSFFTTWFSNPTTWFYFLVTAIMMFYCSVSRR